MSAHDIAHVMTDCVVEFAAKSPRHLRQITVCIFQPPMVQQFADAVAKKANSTSWRQTVTGIVIEVVKYTVPHEDCRLGQTGVRP